jgi:hypothetical protein
MYTYTWKLLEVTSLVRTNFLTCVTRQHITLRRTEVLSYDIDDSPKQFFSRVHFAYIHSSFDVTSQMVP